MRNGYAQKRPVDCSNDREPMKSDSRDSSKAAGPIALVTGSGADRVGNRLVRSLAADGYAVAVHYRSSDAGAASTVREITEQGGTARAFQADVSQEVDVDQLMGDVVGHFGRLDLLVTTASRWDRKSLEEITAADVQAAFAVDALGSFLCARRAGLLMAQQDSGGSIVLIGDASVKQPRTGQAAYYLAKGSIPTMTRVLAAELADRHPSVRVNAILPGSILAPDASSADDHARRIGQTLTQLADDPQSVANAVRYLAESPLVTGTCLTLDGGRSIKSPD